MNAPKLKESILAARDCAALCPVEVPEWGVTVHLRTLSAGELHGYQLAVHERKPGAFTAHLLVRAIGDETGARVFTDADAVELSAHAGGILDRLFDLAKAHNGLTRDQLEDARKNSEGGTADSSTS